MSLGQFLVGAGRVWRGMREAEDAERRARENQLRIEEQNRIADWRAAAAQRARQQPEPMVQAPAFAPSAAPAMAPGLMLPLETIAPPAAPRPTAAGLQPSLAPPTPTAAPPQPAVAPVAAPPQPAAAPSEQTGELPPAIERLGVQLDKAREDYQQAYDALQRFGVRQRNRDPLGYTAAVAAEKQAKQAKQAAQAAFESAAAPYALPVSRGGLRLPFGAQQAAPAEAPAAPAAPAGRTPTQYDKPTAYDAIIQQSAQQYGIDPTVFKRLIGTESSFNPAAVSPRGERFGLGIAQINEIHGLTREQRLDPNFAIPFAAQLFAQYLREANGNYEEALLRYKGASSAKGRADMAAPVATILSGVAPAAAPAAPTTRAAAAAPAAPAPLEVPTTQARNMEMAEFYLANRDSIPFEAQQLQQVIQQAQQSAQRRAEFLTRQRNEAAQLARFHEQSGTVPGAQQAAQLRTQVSQIDAQLLDLQDQFEQVQLQANQKQVYLQGMQGVREFAVARDPRRLSSVLSLYMGVPVGIQPRSDGNYNYFVNGQRVQEGVPASKIVETALREFSPEARAAAAASAALENKLALEAKFNPALTAARIKAVVDIQTAIINGEYKLSEEIAKRAGLKTTTAGEGKVLITLDGKALYLIDANEVRQQETAGGPVTLPPLARPITLGR